MSEIYTTLSPMLLAYNNPITTAQRNAITGQLPSTVIFNSDVGHIEIWDGSAWNPIGIPSSPTGLPGFDEFYLTTTISHTGNSVVTTWSNSGATIGSPMTISSAGHFTFPSTGVWLVCARAYYRVGLNTAQFTLLDTYFTTNNFSSEARYDRNGSIVGNGGGSANVTGFAYGEVSVTISDTANDKVRFKALVGSSGDYQLYAGRTNTRVSFKKIG